jgi:hypothetical protein
MLAIRPQRDADHGACFQAAVLVAVFAVVRPFLRLQGERPSLFDFDSRRVDFINATMGDKYNGITAPAPLPARYDARGHHDVRCRSGAAVAEAGASEHGLDDAPPERGGSPRAPGSAVSGGSRESGDPGSGSGNTYRHGGGCDSALQHPAAAARTLAGAQTNSPPSWTSFRFTTDMNPRSQVEVQGHTPSRLIARLDQGQVWVKMAGLHE